MHRKDLQAAAAIVLFYVIIESFGITCPILYVTGISCAGCGMSRAWLCLLRGDLAGAFTYHPLFWLPVPGAVLLLFQRKIPRRWFRWGIGTICALFLIVYLVRMLAIQDPVVVFRPSGGLVGRIVSRLLTSAGS